jgi:thiamine-phosphate diphosphorylase
VVATAGPGFAERLAVYLVADPDQTERDLLEVVESALAGGVTAVQLRSKHQSDRQTVALAERIAERCRTHEAMFLVNDRLDLALAAGADGVHLGVDDLPVEHARRLGGKELVIGFSPESDEQAAAAREMGASYLGVGPVFGTHSKADAGVAIGSETLARRVRLAGIPVIGIGGITSANAVHVIEAGSVGVAVVAAILRASDPRSAAFDLARAVRQALAPGNPPK